MNRIHVHVVHYRECKNLVMRYIDPMTGKSVRSTTYTDPQTGVKTETGDNRKQARKLAAQWEADLNAGRDQGRHGIGWQQFRDRYEAEVVPGLAVRTGMKIATVFNSVEKTLPRIAQGKLIDLDPGALSLFQAELRSAGRSENTIAGYLAHLRAALQWAADEKMILSVPKIRRPKRAKKGGAGQKAKGRPVTAEEFERMLGKVPAAFVEWRNRKRDLARATRQRRGCKPKNTRPAPVAIEVSPAAVASWQHYLRGLWLSGLRLSESMQLYWGGRPDKLCIDLAGQWPMMTIPAGLEKGNRDRRLPITPDFAGFLQETPEADRPGRVFRPVMPSDNLATTEQAGRMVALIGEVAGVVVHQDPRTGRKKFASAHDLRRSFGNRWAKRVMPAVLQKLMRHESIQTTMGYYVDLDADELAEEVWKTCQGGREGTVLGTVAGRTVDTSVSRISASADR